MSYIMYLLLFLVVIGLIGVASNPSPSFAALSLVVVAGSGCGVLACQGGPFLSLILFLIYLGGMLVVFAYSVAFTASLNTEGWGSRSIFSSALMYFLGVFMVAVLFVKGWDNEFWAVGLDYSELGVVRGGIVGASFLYWMGAGLLVIGAWALLLVLFVVLKLVRGISYGAIRAV
uniref:NADH dehydrogenase subunit 6 n=1 Tax=Millerichthys robustus TaxID=2588674 RepID=UPI00315D4117